MKARKLEKRRLNGSDSDTRLRSDTHDIAPHIIATSQPKKSVPGCMRCWSLVISGLLYIDRHCREGGNPTPVLYYGSVGVGPPPARG
jgi:hypothetical protein